LSDVQAAPLTGRRASSAGETQTLPDRVGGCGVPVTGGGAGGTVGAGVAGLGVLGLEVLGLEVLGLELLGFDVLEVLGFVVPGCVAAGFAAPAFVEPVREPDGEPPSGPPGGRFGTERRPRTSRGTFQPDVLTCAFFPRARSTMRTTPRRSAGVASTATRRSPVGAMTATRRPAGSPAAMTRSGVLSRWRRRSTSVARCGSARSPTSKRRTARQRQRPPTFSHEGRSAWRQERFCGADVASARSEMGLAAAACGAASGRAQAKAARVATGAARPVRPLVVGGITPSVGGAQAAAEGSGRMFERRGARGAPPA
jgi:hypothetical protein